MAAAASAWSDSGGRSHHASKARSPDSGAEWAESLASLIMMSFGVVALPKRISEEKRKTDWVQLEIITFQISPET